MGCLMNVLWLLFGGILTAIEYVVASLLLMVRRNSDGNRICGSQSAVDGDHCGYSFRHTDAEDGFVGLVAFRQGSA